MASPPPKPPPVPSASPPQTSAAADPPPPDGPVDEVGRDDTTNKPPPTPLFRAVISFSPRESTGPLAGVDDKGEGKFDVVDVEEQAFGLGRLPQLDARFSAANIQKSVSRIFDDTPSVFVKVLHEDNDIKQYYKKLDLIGDGDSAWTYEVIDVNDPSKRLAMKVQPRNQGDDFRLYEELVILNRILPKHKHIVELKDLLMGPDYLYIVTELLEKGINLNNFFPVADCRSGRRIFSQVVKTVRCIHQYGVRHNDLLAQNIMFTDPTFTHVKIIDFGRSVYNRALAERQNESFRPEHWFDIDELDNRSHLFSSPRRDIGYIGVLLLSIVVGRPVSELMDIRTEAAVKHLYKMRKDLFPKPVHDLLRQIGPYPWGPIDQTFPSIEEIYKNPWISEGDIDESATSEHEDLKKGLVPLSRFMTIVGEVTPKILEFDYEVVNHYEKLGCLQKDVVERTVFECIPAEQGSGIATSKKAMKLLPRVGSHSTDHSDNEAKVPFSLYKEVIILTKVLPPHENKIEMKDVIISDEYIYVITELHEHFTLADFIPLAVAQKGKARQYFKQIAETVRWFHKYGVVHMDLHPKHIVLAEPLQSDYCRCKIIDFSKAAYVPGLVKERNPSFNESTWFKPEALLMVAKNGRVETDIRALGRILHAMMVGLWTPPDPTTQVAMPGPEKGVFEPHASDLLSKIGPPPFGPAEGDPKLLTMDEICDHPWLVDTVVKGKPLQINLQRR